MPSIYKAIFLFFISSSCVLGQSFFEKIKYQAEAGVYLSTSGKTPFLTRANQYGIVPLESSVVAIKGGIYKDYDSTFNSNNQLHKFGFGFGVNAIGNVGKVNEVLLPEAYLKVRYGAFELSAGRKREIIGLVDTVLTMGSYIWSGNALPIPKVQISIPNYVPILGKGLLSIKGLYSDGFFDNGAIRNFYLHQKNLYARIGKPNWKIKIYSGFNHQVQWGGKPATPYIDKTTGLLVTTFPSDFNTYLKVVAGTSLNKGDNGVGTGIPVNEAMNRAGNHLGTIDIATEINFKKFDIFLYRQNIYEDGSLFYLNNISDGLTGISFRRKNAVKGIVRVCFEYLHTTNQGGSLQDRYDDIPQLRGADNYFNNGVYTDGWTYGGNTIGTPLLTPINSVDKKLLANKDLEKYSTYYILNRVEAFSLAIEGKGKNINYYTKLIFNKNLGTYQVPINAKQFSFLYKVKYNFPQFSLISYLSFDEGTLFPSSLGGYLGIQRTFF
ncbi:capsule assembly Wzi family protein [Emticicia agri]|uniref:Capsule assembly Wzi family protein n=1 Tax=Emticicia agri TaxID=2492393 RepID=A0A4Q5LX71_9BACT|nr:capsule assembly Wzi family protein [Emticicia agri]RYU94358.1 capsule assembly Wzi family protein [Emticicia agri]